MKSIFLLSAKIINLLNKKSITKPVGNSLLFVYMLSLFFSCTNPRQTNFDSKPEVKASKKIEDSFSTLKAKETSTNNIELGKDKLDLVIKKASLEKEFLFQSSMITQTTTAMPSGLKSRIVAFKQRGSSVYMLEATQGHSVTPDLPQNLVLAEFTVKEESDENLVIDFSKGMSHLFTAGEWRASDDANSSEYNPNIEFASADVSFSFIEESKIENNILVMRQIAQLKSKTPQGEVNIPLEVKYYITPYSPDLNYKPFKSPGFNKVGYFESAPQATGDGLNVIHATRFNPDKPIVFALSSNTPEAYKQAVKEGVLYWSKIFGEDKFKVINAPAGVVAPDSQYNVIQWVPFEQAGFAYADAQVDPRTGETLHAQVVMTSVFAIGGRDNARKILRSLSESKKSKIRVGLSGFNMDTTCALGFTSNFEKELENLVQSNVSDEDILKISQDYVREVVAHEVGHTLGLRHNFAGSLGSNIDSSERKKVFQDYVVNKKLEEGKVSSSSVMEYEDFIDAAQSGDFVEHSRTALAYDKAAIEILYLGKDILTTDVPLFCTDSSESKYIDCKVWDYGRNYMDYHKDIVSEQLEILPSSILEIYIRAKTAPKSNELLGSLENVKLPNEKKYLSKLLDPAWNVLLAMTNQKPMLTLRSQYLAIDSLNQEQVERAELDYLKSEIERVGGHSKIFNLYTQFSAVELSLKLKALLEQHSKGIGYNDKPYEFSSKEIEIILKKGEQYFSWIERELIHANLEVLSGVPVISEEETLKLSKFKDHQISHDFAEFLSGIVKDVVFTTTDELQFIEIEIPDQNKSDTKKTQRITAKLPKFKFGYSERALSAGLLDSDRAESPDWAIFERRDHKKEFTKLMKSILTVGISDLEAENMPNRPAARWILENQKISNALGN